MRIHFMIGRRVPDVPSPLRIADYIEAYALEEVELVPPLATVGSVALVAG